MIANELNKHYLFPSTLFVDAAPCMIDTILGSCVAVCLYDTRLRIGGMNHYMLPLWNGEGLASPKYGNIANEKLLEKMLRAGASKQSIIAKVFGGANQINSAMTIGDRNVEVAREQLQGFGIRIATENVGGVLGRKIKFDTSTGEVLMRFIANTLTTAK